MMNNENPLSHSVRVEIIEQPAPNKLRFRYAVEGRGAGALLGQRSTGDNRTFPTIRIHGYKGLAVVVVSCIEHKPISPGVYRTHPHKIGKKLNLFAQIGRRSDKKSQIISNFRPEIAKN